ncbi:hypothetical protein AX15_005434 [Amanita polypyramis BW_CC]|nr:hypothetical protein AX15_005434 [Amanita polypyramis BW_CC]
MVSERILEHGSSTMIFLPLLSKVWVIVGGRDIIYCVSIDRIWISYLPFPSTWPLHSPAPQFANWLEAYAEALELNVWTSSTVLKVSQDPVSKKWDVTVKCADGSERVLDVKHVIFGTGFGGIEPNIPDIAGKEAFKGQILHSTQFKRGSDHIGKKVVIIGSGTFAHDIAQDLYEEGIGVPLNYVASLDLLDALHARGFKTNLGCQDTGFFLVFSAQGRFHVDTGSSHLFADGKVKLKNDSSIKGFTEKAIVFEDGSELPADLVVFAAGLGNTKGHVYKICGEDVTEKKWYLLGM